MSIIHYGTCGICGRNTKAHRINVIANTDGVERCPDCMRKTPEFKHIYEHLIKFNYNLPARLFLCQ